MPKLSSLKNSSMYYLTHSWEDKGVHTFPKGICPKVNVIAWLEYEFTYYDSISFNALHHEDSPLHLGVVAIEKEAFGSPVAMVANFIYKTGFDIE